MGGHVKRMLRGVAADEVHRRLAAKPDWTVRALAADRKAAGIDVSHDTVWRFLRRRQDIQKNADCQRAGQAEGGASEAAGRPINIDLIRAAWCSSTKPGSRPT
ncbi:hypothetical protein [Sinorhizobium medicae]|uniref:hypothetical protein n=1 Tax=Sinorhizobium medicae TaxID=110321 RepID=UPI002B1BE04B|nr:hypothetical protein [Sinorhizobium medicae]